MPARVIRAEINSSDSLNRVSIEADLTFRALIVACDDYGRFDARPGVLKAALFPIRDAMTPARILKAIGELERVGCVRRYQSEGREFLYLPSWERHRGKGRRGNASKYPDPPGDSGASAEILGSACASEEMYDRVEGREARDEKREARDVSRDGPARSARGAAKSDAPEALSEAETQALETWCRERWPTLVPRVRDLVSACLTFHSGKGNRHANWYKTAQTWIRNEAEGRFGKQAAPATQIVRPRSSLPDSDELARLSRMNWLPMPTLDYWREWVAAGKPERARWWIQEAQA